MGDETSGARCSRVAVVATGAREGVGLVATLANGSTTVDGFAAAGGSEGVVAVVVSAMVQHELPQAALAMSGLDWQWLCVGSGVASQQPGADSLVELVVGLMAGHAQRAAAGSIGTSTASAQVQTTIRR